jgi:signal peptidase II
VSRFEAWRRALLLIGGVFLLDQATKQVALERLAFEEPVDLVLGFQFDYVTNSGIAFGFFDSGEGLVSVLTVFTVAALATWLTLNPSRPGLWLTIGLLIGGALGNLADRVRMDAVIDFLDPPAWPAFNVADVAITAGVVVLIFSVWRAEPQ